MPLSVRKKIRTKIKMSYTIDQISKMDAEMRDLQAKYTRVRVFVGLELAKRLKVFEDYKLYLKLDERSYPNFAKYLESINVNYKTAREIIGLYEAYVITAEIPIVELAEIAYSRLTDIKRKFFRWDKDKYLMLESKTELKKWLEELKSDITQEDLRQRVREDIAGEHEHDWNQVTYQYCRVCKLKEPISYGKIENKIEEKTESTGGDNQVLS
jgi:hypothetical protein